MKPKRPSPLLLRTIATAVCLLSSCRDDRFSIRFSPRSEGAPETASKAWRPAVNIGAGLEVHVALDSGGEAFAVWTSPEGRILVARSTGDGWSTATSIDSGEGPAMNPQIAIDPTGGAAAVWSQADRIHARRYSEGIWEETTIIDAATWSHPSETRTLVHAGDPRIGFDSLGNAVAVWHQVDGVKHWYGCFSLQDGDYEGIFTNRFSGADALWGAAQPLWTDDGFDGSSYPLDLPRLAVDSGGEAVSLLRSQDQTSSYVDSSHFRGDPPEWKHGILFDTPLFDGIVLDVELVSRSGYALAVWAQDGIEHYPPPTDAEIRALLSPDGGGWSPPPSPRRPFWIHAKRYAEGSWEETVVLSSPTSHSTMPQVALDGEGKGLVVWRESSTPEAEDGRIMAKWYGAESGGEEGEVAISEGTFGNAVGACLAFDGGGDAVVVCVQAREGGRGAQAIQTELGMPSSCGCKGGRFSRAGSMPWSKSGENRPSSPPRTPARTKGRASRSTATGTRSSCGVRTVRSGPAGIDRFRTNSLGAPGSDSE